MLERLAFGALHNQVELLRDEAELRARVKRQMDEKILRWIRSQGMPIAEITLAMITRRFGVARTRAKYLHAVAMSGEGK